MTAGRPIRVDPPTVEAPADEPPLLAVLVAEAVGTALASLDALERNARDVADGFRQGRVDEANRGLTSLVQGTQTLVKLAVMTACATETDLVALCRLDGAQIDADLKSAVGQIATRQLASDWPGLADTLELDFLPALGQWRQVFTSLGADAPTPGPDGMAA